MSAASGSSAKGYRVQVVGSLVAGALATSGLAGCQPTSGPSAEMIAGLAPERSGDAAVVPRGWPALEGRIEHLMIPLPVADRTTQALTTDVANGATVSLIETDSGRTVSTAVSSSDGTFAVKFPSNFVPEAEKPYYLEAVKGLPVGGDANRAGAAIARVRTLVAFAGTWSSLSGGGIVISPATTAVSIIAAYRDLAVADQLALLGKLSGNTLAAGQTAIAAEDLDRVLALVQEALQDDQDPVGSIGYFPGGTSAAGRYARRAGDLVLHDSVTPSAVGIGGTATILGQNLPLAGISTPAIAVAGIPVASWQVDAARSELTFSLAASGFSGWFTIADGAGLWSGPLVPVRGTVGTFAGTGQAGTPVGRHAREAAFDYPSAVAADGADNLYLSDKNGIWKISPAGAVTTLCPLLGGIQATSITADALGNVYALANHQVWKITPAGQATVLAGSGTVGSADGAGTLASFNNPTDLDVDSGGTIFVCDYLNHCIRKVSPGGVVTTFVTGLSYPHGLGLDSAGNLYIGHAGQNKIDKVTPDGNRVTLAGTTSAGNVDGTGTAALFYWPSGVAVDGAGNLFVADYRNHRVRRVTQGGVVTTVAGSGAAGGLEDGGYAEGPATATARLDRPYHLTVDSKGRIYVADRIHERVRVIVPE